MLLERKEFMDRNNDSMDTMKHYVSADIHGYFTELK